MHSRGFHHLPVVEGDHVVGVISKNDLLVAAANYGSAEVPVDEIMSVAPVCVTENSQLKSAARLLVLNHIGCLPVLNTRKMLVGIITETDIFKITAGMLDARPTATKPLKKLVNKAIEKPVRKVTKKE